MTLTSSIVYDVGGDCVSLIIFVCFARCVHYVFFSDRMPISHKGRYSIIKWTGKVGQSLNAEKTLVVAGFMRYRFARAMCRSE